MTRAIISHRRMSPEKFVEEVNPLINEIENTGYYSGKFLSRWSLAIAAEKSGDITCALERYKELAAYCREIESPVLEFIPLQSIKSLAIPSSTEAASAVEQENQRLKDLLQQATIPPVKTLARKLRAKNRKTSQ
jgi:hypothetical protein